METANKTFKLLSKLLSENSPPNTPYNDLYEKLFSYVGQEVAAQLNKSTYPQKSKLISKLQSVLDDVEILTQFPEIIGKTIIGIMGSGSAIERSLLDRISVQNAAKIYKYNNNMPAIIYGADEEKEIKAVNLIESPALLEAEDFVQANTQLYKQKIDIRQFIFAFSVSAKIPYDNIAYINFPLYSIKAQPYYENLLGLADIIIIPVDERGSWEAHINYLRQHRINKPIYLLINEAQLEAALNKIEAYEADFVSINVSLANIDLDTIVRPADVVRNNASISVKVLRILNDFNLYQTQKIDKLTNTISGINKDLLGIDDEETGFSIKKIKAELDDSLDAAKKDYADFLAMSESLMELIYQFEDSLYNAASEAITEEIKSPDVIFHDDYEENCAELIMGLIEVGNFALARQFINKPEWKNYTLTYIFNLYMDDMMNRSLSMADLGKLKKETAQNNLIIRAKVKFGEEIGLSKDEIGAYAQKIKGRLNAHENYALAEFYARNNIEKAKELYANALDLGFLPAGDKLIEYWDSRNYFELENLANKLVPEANYIYGIQCLGNNKYARGITYLKIAATFGNIKAIRELANIEFSNAVRGYRNPTDRTEKSINIAFELYQYLLSQNPSDEEAMENLGQIYFWEQDYRRSRQLLEQCSTANALYMCGRMYQYGDGIAQDIYKARDLFKKAADKGHVRAKVEYEKVCGWIAANSVQQSYSYSADHDYSTRSTSSHVSSSRGGLCFITTATCMALGKEDDCEELLAFKAYRDNHLIYDADGAALIREYYRIAPSIIESIDRQALSRDVYQGLWDEYIAVGYEYLKKNDLDNAKRTYIGMVRMLCEKYGVSTVYEG